MAINSTTTSVDYAGDGSSTVFAVSYVFFGAAELEVIERNLATGAETTKTIGTHYTVAGGNGASGSVTALVAPPSGTRWYIRRKTARVQQTVYAPNDPFPAASHERALDRLTAIAQEVAADGARALLFPKTDGAALLELPADLSRANKLLGFDASGNPVATTAGAVALGTGDVTGDKIADGALSADPAGRAKMADGFLTAAKIAANAVGLDKLGRAGTAGQVLTSGGPGADPSYQTPAGAGVRFGTGADGALNTSGNVNLTTSTGVDDTGLVIRNYTSITINAGHTVTAANRARAMILYCTGNVSISGTLTMSARGAAATVSADVALTRAVTDALLTSETALTVFRSVQVGGALGAGGTAAPTAGSTGGTITNGTGGGGGGGGCGSTGAVGGNGAAGTAICGGAGGGGAANFATSFGAAATGNGGAGGNGANMTSNSGGGGGGGAGNGGGTGGTFNSTGTNGTAGTAGAGGLLIIIAAGTVTINGGGVISANGSAGGAGGNGGGSNNGSGGGGSGGGRIIILSAGAYTNSGTVQANGGAGGAAGTGGSGGTAGGAGGAGAITQSIIVA